jgi:hypothetical protein
MATTILSNRRDLVEQTRAARDDVDVTVGQRIERAGVDGERHERGT